MTSVYEETKLNDVYEMEFEDFQQAFIQEIITLDQFIDTLNYNFGHVKTRAILKRNLKLARKMEGRELRERNAIASQASQAVPSL